jgi:hypothetical protein
MVDADDNYALNSYIQSICFKGETTPGDNTMGAQELDDVKDYIDGKINEPCHWTTNYSGHASNPFFKNTFIRLFKQHMKGIEEPELTDSEEQYLLQLGEQGPIAMQRSDDYDEPDSI